MVLLRIYLSRGGLSCDDADGGGVLGGADKVDAVGEGQLVAVGDFGQQGHKASGHVVDAHVGVGAGAAEADGAGIAFNRERIVNADVGDAGLTDKLGLGGFGEIAKAAALNVVGLGDGGIVIVNHHGILVTLDLLLNHVAADGADAGQQVVIDHFRSFGP